MMLPQYQRHAAWLAVLFYLFLLTLYFFSDLAIRPIWADETFSYYQVRDRSFSAFLDSMKDFNFMPYLYFIMLWGLDQLFGLGALLLRLPSLIFALGAVMLVHRLLKQRWGLGVAFMACVSALLLSRDFVQYSHEARPYALYLLAAAFSLSAATALLRPNADLRPALLSNGFAAFLLPATHYVGGFYSVLVALALLVGWRKGWRWRLSVAGSFIGGWLLFGVLHLSQLLRHAGNHNGMSWIPKPGIAQVYDITLKTLALPSAAIAILLGYVACYLFAADAVKPRGMTVEPQHKDADRFWFVVVLLWLLLPSIFYLFGALGLLNMSLPRYFVPSLLAVAIVVAMLLACFLPKWQDGGKSAMAIWRRVDRGIVIVLAFSAYPALAALGHIYQSYQHPPVHDSQATFRDIAESPIPCVTNNIHVFAEYNFQQRNGQRLYLLRETAAEAQGYHSLDGNLPVLTIDELHILPVFRFFYKKGSVNSFPDFDIRSWADSHGYVATEEAGREGMDVYTLRNR